MAETIRIERNGDGIARVAMSPPEKLDEPAAPP
jgi:hypothetical protein